MDFKKQKPIFRQIADRLSDQVLEGRFQADDRLPSVRDVAADLGVNPNTVVRSFELLSDEGIIYNRRGMGYYAAADAREKVLASRKNEFLNQELPELKQKMQLLGITFEQISQALQ